MVAQLVNASRGRIVIMAGGRIGISQAASIIERTGVREIHVGLATPAKSPMIHRNNGLSLGRAEGREYQRTEVLEENVRKLKRAISPASS